MCWSCNKNENFWAIILKCDSESLNTTKKILIILIFRRITVGEHIIDAVILPVPKMVGTRLAKGALEFRD